MSKKVTVEQFIKGLLAIEALKPKYVWGGKGLNGKCDCIGLAIGAFREVGFTWNGLHGTNYAARYAVTGLTLYQNESQLVPGMWLFTARKPSNGYYALPGKYQKGGANDTGDYNDYSHVYYVLSINPTVLIHCTKSGSVDGVVRITQVPSGRYIAYSKYIDYETKGGEETMAEQQNYPTLRKGQKGADVAKLQQMLITLGYDVGKTGADGIYGTATHSAVWQFQDDNDLAKDGIAGKDTWAKLYSLSAAGTTAGSDPEKEEHFDKANLTILDMPRDKYFELKEWASNEGYQTEKTHG